VAADILRYLNKSPHNRARGDTLRSRLSAFLTPDLLCLSAYRIAHWLHVNGWRRAATAVSRVNFFAHKVWIPPQSCIGAGCRLPHPAGVTFCGRAGRGLTLYSLSVCCALEGADAPLELSPVLGDRVTVGAHAVLLGPLRIGDDVKIAFQVRLDRDAPPRALVVSRILRPTFTPAARVSS
jgi:serine acetyltransferase